MEALSKIFGPYHPEPDFQDLHVSIEYPNQPQNYPGIWITYSDEGPIERAGIDHLEVTSDTEGAHAVTRWRFSGSISFTCAAFSSLERDRLFDEMVRVLAFTNAEPNSMSFKELIEANDFIGMNLQYDSLQPSGDAVMQGTPWGSPDESIYERTVSTQVIGEFVSDPSTNLLVPLSKVLVQGYLDGTPTPDFPDAVPVTGRPYEPTEWI